jgi:endonuclease G
MLGPINDLLERTAYTASYNRKDRIPHWVGEHLTADSLVAGEGVTRDKSRFKDDGAVPDLFKVFTKDYTNSGYDRGHMAPAGDAVATQQAMDETFLLTNIAPQIGPGFNRQYWAYLEKFCRELTKNYTDVYVYTGPLFLPQLQGQSVKVDLEDDKVAVSQAAGKKYKMQYDMIGSAGPTIAVPTHYFKILLVNHADEFILAAFVLPNQAIDHKIPLSQFQVGLEAIEKASGLVFFDQLDRTTFKNLCDQVQCIV